MKLISTIIILFVLSISFSAQSPSKVISQANKALGGEKSLKSITSWQQTGKITRFSDGATGNYSAYASGVTFFGGMYDLNGFEVAFAYNGKSGWSRDSKNGLKTLTGDAGKELQAEAAYRNTRWLKIKDDKSKLSSAGTATVNGKPANVVVMTTAKAVKIKLFFDAVSGMLVREEVPQGGKSFEYSDYRTVNGVQTPFAFRLVDGEETYGIKLDDVKYNVAVAGSSFDFPKMSSEALPDIPTLFNEIRANADKVNAILENYSFTETRIDRDVNSSGDFVIKGSEKRLATFYKGYRISRLLEKNDKPLSPSDQAKEDREAQKQVAEIEKKIANKEKKTVSAGVGGQPKDDGERLTIADALKGSLLVNARRERFKNRDVIVFDYEPNPAFKPQTRNEKLFALCNGAVWVDNATKQVVRLEAVLTQNAGNFIAKAKRGASFSLENEIINNEIWLPSQADINLQIKILFAGININNLIKYGDYRRFETEVKDAKVGEEKKPN